MLLKNCILIDYSKEVKGDVRIKDGKISLVADSIDPKDGEKTIDLEGKKYLLPGAIDLNFHINNVASKKVEAFDEAVKSAYKGGITTILLHPDCEPNINNESHASFVHLKAKSEGFLNILTLGDSVTEEKLNDVAVMLNSGVKTVSIDSSKDSNLLRRALEYTKTNSSPLVVNPKNEALESAGVIHDGEVSAQLGLPGLPSFSESSEIAKVGEIAIALDSSILINYVSSKSSVDVIARLKEKGSIHSAVPLNNLFMCDDACGSFNTIPKTFPPLRSSEDRESLIDGIKNNVIDVISSNHIAKSYVSKDVPFEEASFGLANSGIFFSLINTFLVKTEKLSWMDITQVTSKNPADILGLNKGSIEEGKDADLVIFNPATEFTVSNENFDSQIIGNISNFGEKLTGRVESVILGGEEVL